MLSILLMLCARCAWSDEVLELQPRLSEAAGAQGLAYVELRDRLVSTVSTNALFQAVDDERLEWRERLVARICVERILRGSDIADLRSVDWASYPPYQPQQKGVLVFTEMPDGSRSAEMHPPGSSIGSPRSGPSYLMKPYVIAHCQKTALWYYYIELTWKRTGEGPLNIGDIKFIRQWPRWCRMALAGRPEEVYLLRAMTERIEKDELLEAADATRLYRELLDAKWPEAVPVLVRRYEAYNKREIRGPEYFEGRHAQLYRGMFQPILDMADHRHAELLEANMASQPRLAELLPSLADVRGRTPVEAKAEPSFYLGTADDL